MTAEEQTILNTALSTAGREQVVVTKTQDAVLRYYLCSITNLQEIPDIIAFGESLGVTIEPEA